MTVCSLWISLTCSTMMVWISAWRAIPSLGGRDFSGGTSAMTWPSGLMTRLKSFNGTPLGHLLQATLSISTLAITMVVASLLFKSGSHLFLRLYWFLGLAIWIRSGFLIWLS